MVNIQQIKGVIYCVLPAKILGSVCEMFGKNRLIFGTMLHTEQQDINKQSLSSLRLDVVSTCVRKEYSAKRSSVL